jgi:hypothetical protein
MYIDTLPPVGFIFVIISNGFGASTQKFNILQEVLSNVHSIDISPAVDEKIKVVIGVKDFANEIYEDDGDLDE